MAKTIAYKLLSAELNHGTGQQPDIERIFLDKIIVCSDAQLEANEEIAKKEAYNGEYTVTDDGTAEQIFAPHNMKAGEYVTIEGVLYLATENIPCGEPVIAGQNAVKTSIEQQLKELKGA